MQALIRAGLITLPSLGLGVDADCRVIDPRGRPRAISLAMGPLTRNRFAEVM